MIDCYMFDKDLPQEWEWPEHRQKCDEIAAQGYEGCALAS